MHANGDAAGSTAVSGAAVAVELVDDPPAVQRGDKRRGEKRRGAAIQTREWAAVLVEGQGREFGTRTAVGATKDMALRRVHSLSSANCQDISLKGR